jgi:predicted PurR-regulated permease PerM
LDTSLLPPAGLESPQPYRPQWQPLITLGFLALGALYFLWRVRDILPPFFIAFFIAALLDPVVTRLQRKGRSRARAVLTIYLLVFLLFVLAAMAIGPPVVDQVESLINNRYTYEKTVSGISNNLYKKYEKPLNAIGIKNPLGNKSDKPARPDQGEATSPVVKAVLGALNSVKDTIFGFAGKAIWLIIIPLALFYFLMDFQRLRARLIAMAPQRHHAMLDTMSEEVVLIFTAYFRSLAIVCALYGMTAIAVFYILGLQYALFLGIAAGVLYAVPYVGPAITVGSVTIIGLMTEHPTLFHTGIHLSPFVFAVISVLMFVSMHVTFDYGITPRIVGGSVGLHPIANIFALMCGATLFGVWGMLLAVPVAASIQIVLIYFFPKLSQPLPQLSLPPGTAADGGAAE